MGLWAAVLVYSIFSFLSGPKGLFAYNQLLAEYETQLENLEELGRLNKELKNTTNSLYYDEDTLAVYARQLGYSRENERFVRIVGLPGKPAERVISAGKIYYPAEPSYVSDRIIKITAFSVGLIVFAFCFTFEYLRFKKPV
jgi:cell division protein FtsB